MMKVLGIGYLCVVGLMSLITFASYGWDKRQARNDARRISENRLHTLAMLGGWPGALLGRRFFHHKTQKTGFTIKTWLIVAAHVGLIATFLFLLSSRA